MLKDLSLLSSVCGAERMAECFLLTSSTLPWILSMLSLISSTWHKTAHLEPVLWIRNDLLRIRIIRPRIRFFRWFWIRLRILFRIYFNINFKLYPLLVIVLCCLLQRDISFLGELFVNKEIFIFKLSILIEKLSNFISLSLQFYFKFISHPELPGSGSGMIFPDSDPAKVYDPTWSGSTTLLRTL